MAAWRSTKSLLLRSVLFMLTSTQRPRGSRMRHRLGILARL